MEETPETETRDIWPLFCITLALCVCSKAEIRPVQATDIPCTFQFLGLWARHTSEQVSSFPVHV
jgi:hypothetical protein